MKRNVLEIEGEKIHENTMSRFVMFIKKLNGPFWGGGGLEVLVGNL